MTELILGENLFNAEVGNLVSGEKIGRVHQGGLLAATPSQVLSSAAELRSNVAPSTLICR